MEFVAKNEVVCGNCVHYVQHYRYAPEIISGNFDKVYCGHCIYPRRKDREPDHKACKHWQSKINKKEAV